jgi:hypothetical protein
MMIHRVVFYYSWNESFAYRLLDLFSSRNDVMMKRKNRNNCEIIFLIISSSSKNSIFFYIFHISRFEIIQFINNL